MNRQDKIKLLKKVAKGDNSSLISLNKGLAVLFLDMVENKPIWIDHDYLTDNRTTTEILTDNTIRKYTSIELKQIQKRRDTEKEMKTP